MAGDVTDWRKRRKEEGKDTDDSNPIYERTRAHSQQVTSEPIVDPAPEPSQPTVQESFGCEGRVNSQGSLYLDPGYGTDIPESRLPSTYKILPGLNGPAHVKRNGEIVDLTDLGLGRTARVDDRPHITRPTIPIPPTGDQPEPTESQPDPTINQPDPTNPLPQPTIDPDYQKELDDLKSRVGTLETEFDEFRSRYGDIPDRVQTLEDQYTRLQQQVEELSNNYTELGSRLSDLESNYEDVTGQLQEIREEFERYKEENDPEATAQLRKEFEEYKQANDQRVGELEDEVDELTGRVADLELYRAENDRRVTDLEKRVASLEKGRELMVATVLECSKYFVDQWAAHNDKYAEQLRAA